MKTQTEIDAVRRLHKLLAEACAKADAADATATLCDEEGGPVDGRDDERLATCEDLYVSLDLIPHREGVRPLTDSGRREMRAEQDTLDSIEALAAKHGILGAKYHIDSEDGPGYGWEVRPGGRTEA